MLLDQMNRLDTSRGGFSFPAHRDNVEWTSAIADTRIGAAYFS
jgi:hypothetical protein